MHYGRIKDLDTANGIGIRITLFVSGCRNHCKNCFQPETWNFCYGNEYTEDTESYIIELLSRPYVRGLSILGGEPMEPENQSELLGLVRKVKETYPNKDIWMYTGYTIEQLTTDGFKSRCDSTDKILSTIDVLVDGRFVDELKDISLRFRGSSNQRVIDMRETRRTKSIKTMFE